MSIKTFQHIKTKATLDPTFHAQLMSNPLHFLQQYDLTEDEKRNIILPHFNWLIDQKLAALSYPESTDALHLLHQLGIRVLLNLTEIPHNEETLHNAGLLTAHIPIADLSAPTLDQIKQGLTLISSYLAQNQPVAVHCLAGLGRTGCMLACYLIQQGLSADQAITTIRAWRPGSIEVPEQEAIIHEYADLIHTVPNTTLKSI
jgi:atypical dual specificity phosphatase